MAEEGDRPAGLPSERSNKIIYAIGTGVLAIPFVLLTAYSIKSCLSTNLAEKIGEIPVTGFDAPAEGELKVSAGASLVFAVATSYSFEGNPVVMLDVELMRDGAPAARKECNMKSFSGIGARGSGGTTWYGDAGWSCTLDVPAGGVTSMRVTLGKRGSGTIELDHTSVIVKRP